MATMLTTNYQWLADIHSWTDSYNCTYTARLYGRYTEQNTTDATTTVQFKIEYTGSKSSSSYKISHNPTIAMSGGVYIAEKSLGNQTNYANTIYKLAEASATLEHDQTTGALTFDQYAYFKSSYYGGGGKTVSVSVPTIVRKATVTAATDFNDEGNPTVTFSNPGNFTTKPYLKFYDSNNTLVHTITGTSGVTSPYTWTLTDAQRSSLRTATNGQASYTVEEGIETFNGNTSLGTSSINKTFSIINAIPTVSHTIIETDPKVTAALGTSGSTIVKGVSDIKVTLSPSYKKGSNAKSLSIKLGGVTSTTNPAIFTNVTDCSLSYTVTDSRSNSVTKTATLNVVDYIPVSIASCEFRRKEMGSNIVVLDAVVNVNTGTIGDKTNTLTVGYLSSNNKSGTITSYTKGTNKITISNLELGALVGDGEVAAFTLTISDLFTSASATNNVIIPVPVLDAGIHDIQINGDLYLANTDGSNSVNIKDMIKTDISSEIEAKLGVYSMTETRIGTWINGKPLYRRLLPVTTIAGQQVYDIASWNVEIPVHLYGYVMKDGDQRPINFAVCFTDNGPVYFVSCFYVSGTLRLQSHSGYAGLSGYVILEYTKTTD